MAIVITDNKHYKAIADKIRERTNQSVEELQLRPEEMAEGVDGVFLYGVSAGYENGYTEGYENGKAEGGNTEEAYNQGVADGKEAQEQAFWDDFQNYGQPTNFTEALCGSRWNANNFKPKHIFNCISAIKMFSNFNRRSTSQKDLVDFSNVVFDVSELTSATDMFANAAVDNVTLKFSEKITSLNTTFTKGSGGEVAGMSITLLVPNVNCTWSNTFSYHNKLKRLIFLEGTKIGNNLDVSWCSKLPKEDILGIVDYLQDVGATRTLTLGATNLAKLTDAEQAKATEKGWTLA